MDPGAKKQRRRSIRNIRRSANFVPPAVTYGSAWLGEGQDTNISNLVKSLEELKCHDGIDDDVTGHTIRGVSRQNVQYDGEQACDGFSYENSNESAVFCSNSNGNVKNISENVETTRFHGLELQGIRPSLNKSSPSRDALQTQMPSVSNATAANSCGENSSVANMSVQTPHQLSIPESVISHTDDVVVNLDSVLQTPLCLLDEALIEHSIEKQRCGKLDNDANDSECFSNNVEGEIEPRDNVRVGYACSFESLAKNSDIICMRNELSGVDQNSMNDSMSPEFADFCPNSAESSPAIGPMNQAMRSFADASMGSIFNMSFSPMGNHTDSPKLSLSFRQHSNTDATLEHLPKGDTRHQSISPVITMLDDSIISSDPTTMSELITQNDNIRSSSTSVILTSLPSLTMPDTNSDVSNSISHDLNNTYTIEEADAGSAGQIETIQHQQTEAQCSDRSDIQPGVDECMPTMSDNIYVKPKESSEFISTVCDVEVDSSSHLSALHSIVEIPSSPTSLEMDKDGMDCRMLDEVNERVENVQNTEIRSSNCADSDVIRGGVDGGNHPPSCIEQSSQSPSRSMLTDCGNVIDSLDQANTNTNGNVKKKRRKSNKLALLLQESERFVVQQTCNDERSFTALDHNLGGKENEICEDIMDVHESHTDDNCGQKNTRTRRGRKSWDFRKESKSLASVEISAVEKDRENCSSSEFENLQTVYGKQKYVQESPRRLETIKEASEDKNVFLKRRVKRYLEFGSTTQAKEKKRVKKALTIYNGRQCYFPISQPDFDRKMLDVQLLLDT